MVYVGQSVAGLVILIMLLLALRPAIQVKNKKELGVKRASLVYADEKGTKMLVDETLGLQGKPDMIFETWGSRKLIPLEVKSGRLKEEMPHLGDLYQLGCYFLIVEASFGKKPPYGKLVYANKTFKVRNTKKLRKKVLQAVDEMRGMLEETHQVQAAPDFMKCKHCVCQRTVCEWAKINT